MYLVCIDSYKYYHRYTTLMTSNYGFGKSQNAFLKPCSCEDYPCCGHTIDIEVFEPFAFFERKSIPETIEDISEELVKGKSPAKACQVVGIGWDEDEFQKLIDTVRKVAIKVPRQYKVWMEVAEELDEIFFDQDWSDDLY